MTFEEFQNNWMTDIFPHKMEFIREGQSLMNYLWDVWPEEYKRIVENNIVDGVNVDCFYVDNRVPATLNHLKKNWEKFPK